MSNPHPATAPGYAASSRLATAPPRSLAATLFWILRLTCAAEFIGHGMVGVATNPGWLPYFAVVGIPAATAIRLMPLIGLLDLAVGLMFLLGPRWLVVLYAATWGLWTALLRPLAGQGGWEFLEEVRNGLLPMSLLLLGGLGAKVHTSLVDRITPRLDATNAHPLAWLLRLTVAGLLIGHGGVSALTGQVAWATYLAVLGISPATTQALGLAALLGWFEVALGLAVLIRPGPAPLLFICAWKVGTELLRPLAGEALGQFVERAASYGAPLALAVLLAWVDRGANLEQSDPLRPSSGSGAAEVNVARS